MIETKWQIQVRPTYIWKDSQDYQTKTGLNLKDCWEQALLYLEFLKRITKVARYVHLHLAGNALHFYLRLAENRKRPRRFAWTSTQPICWSRPKKSKDLQSKIWSGEITTCWLPHRSATPRQHRNCGRPCSSNRPLWWKNKTNKRTIYSRHALQVQESVAEREWQHHSKRTVLYHQKTSPDWSDKPRTTIHRGMQYIKRIRKPYSGPSHRKHNGGRNSVNSSRTIYSRRALQVQESVPEREWQHHSKRTVHCHQQMSPDWSDKPRTTIHRGIQYIKRIRKPCSSSSHRKHNCGRNSVNSSSIAPHQRVESTQYPSYRRGNNYRGYNYNRQTYQYNENQNGRGYRNNYNSRGRNRGSFQRLRKLFERKVKLPTKPLK